MFLKLERLNKSFGDKRVVRDLSLELERGELLCILGASGCGKTTTLNMIGGFIPPDGGRILLDGQDLTGLPPENRPVSTVFQSYGLFPHMTVLQNVCYGLKFRRLSREEARRKGMGYLEMVGLGDRARSSIHALSGGQQQRVALARALAVEPKLCLLDEPFSNLDAALRTKMRGELKRLQRELGITMVFVTHDQEEALVLSDRIAVMEEGVLAQTAPPAQLYQHPASPSIASFLGVDELVWREDGAVLKYIQRREDMLSGHGGIGYAD